MKTKYFVSALLLLVSTSATATARTTGNDLLEWCKSEEATFSDGVCYGIVIGFISAFEDGVDYGIGNAMLFYEVVVNRAENIYAQRPENFADAVREMDKKLEPYCLPEAGTLRQAIDVAVWYLENHPVSRHQRLSMLLPAAFREVWPCPR